jgi:hypothetical protein
MQTQAILSSLRYNDIYVLVFIYIACCALRDSIFVFLLSTCMINKYCDERTDSK